MEIWFHDDLDWSPRDDKQTDNIKLSVKLQNWTAVLQLKNTT